MHGGHVTAGVAAEDGLENWRKAVERIERPLPMLIENTAGGDGAMARSLDAIGRLWDAVTEAAARGDASDGANLGFCLDTCHANSAGIDLADAADRIKAITGRIDLVHCNNSRDEFGSGRDRHANLGTGTIDPARYWAWSAPRARRSSARPPTRTAAWPPTSVGPSSHPRLAAPLGYGVDARSWRWSAMPVSSGSPVSSRRAGVRQQSDRHDQRELPGNTSAHPAGTHTLAGLVRHQPR